MITGGVGRRPGRYHPCLVTTELVSDLAERIRAAPARAGDTVVVAIDGPAGSGKTSLASVLAAELNCPVVHMDDIYPGWDGLAVAVETLALDILKPLARGAPAGYRRWDWNHDRPADWASVDPAPLLIIEGCGSGSTPGARWLSLVIWMDAPLDVRKARGIARDGEAFRREWDRWARQEETLFAAERTEERADVHIDGTLPLIR